LFIVAAAMVAHSLRYHSQTTTGFAYLLAFASVAVNEITVSSLISSLLLAISLVLVLRGRRWYALEPFAIIATYSVHRLWLGQIFERLGGHKPFPEFKASVALLSAYWIVYLVSYFLRDDRGDQERRLLVASFLLNAAGYLAVLHYQSLYPQWRFWFLLVAGAIYLGVSYFSSRIGRRQGFVLASTLGVALMVAAIPYRYSGARLELLWLVEAESVLAIGWRLADSHLRKLGWLAAGVLSTYVLFHDLSPRFAVWRPPDAHLGWLLAKARTNSPPFWATKSPMWTTAMRLNGCNTNWPAASSVWENSIRWAAREFKSSRRDIARIRNSKPTASDWTSRSPPATRPRAR
jgi:hypothetical protein